MALISLISSRKDESRQFKINFKQLKNKFAEGKCEYGLLWAVKFNGLKKGSGVWNSNKFKWRAHLGGNKNYTNTTTESITVNTDYLTEAEAEWLEELFISNDVYILNPRSTDNTYEGYSRKYIKPCTVTTESYTRKTTANDKLIQYTLELTTSKTKKAQRI